MLALAISGCDKLKSEPAESGTSPRTVILLDGTWEIAEGSMENVPVAFDRKVPVPGLVSLAKPPFEEPGPKVADRLQHKQKDPRRDAFWYRRTFDLSDPIPEAARLKVSKAMFGTRVFINGKLVGDHMPSFTPGWFDVAGSLKPGKNEVVIRVGADREAVTAALPSGFDQEKERYIPGIFDSVNLVLSSTPHLLEVQTVPDITNSLVRVEATLKNAGEGGTYAVKCVVREAKSGHIAGKAQQEVRTDSGREHTISITVPIADCKLWSPETPFLYKLEVDTGTDRFETRFGMRDFRFDPVTKRAMLNGKPYFMRGSNITLYRFFEDPDCGDLPWNEEWVRKLHTKTKDMHWNCLRYCIGFPPEFWYDIADEEGILIQDEFPIWFGRRWPAEIKQDQLALEFSEWMRERWNHPCVVIWDATNETVSDETGPAIRKVRDLDLSDRPWDNGYMPPERPTDVFESHPYHFNNQHFKLSQLETVDRVPRGNLNPNKNQNPVVINEYGWLWLNRDGTPTTLTSNLYKNLLGTNSTTDQRRHVYARYLAADTEFWRCHRNAAAVMHFTWLGYSRSDGQTSDHWLDVKKLELEPEFERYVKNSFEPVALMIDHWRDRVVGRSELRVPVIVINDLDKESSGAVRLLLKSGPKTIGDWTQDCRIEPYGRASAKFAFSAPAELGECQLVAELKGASGRTVRSIRDFEVVDSIDFGLAFGKPAKASSVHAPQHAAAMALDGSTSSYWSSEFKDPAWFQVDLEAKERIGRVVVHWETAYAKAFSIEASVDGQNWTELYKTSEGKGGLTDAQFAPVEARYVRLAGSQRGTKFGYAILEFEVFAPGAKPASLMKAKANP